jgi:multiple sugar transport system ATP-binding protein
MAHLSLKNIEKKYANGHHALKNINLEIKDKELVVLVGPSGCGKSTLLRMIAGLEDISDGDFTIDGVRMNDAHPKDRDIAMVFQNYALYPHMTVYDNMAFGLKLRKMPKDEIDQKVRKVANTLELQDYLERLPKAMSGGQRQRVAIGRAIVRDPKVFLFDEPLSNLDAKLRVQMRTEIKQLHQKLQTTMIYVTHDQVEAMTLGTQIVVLKLGVVQQVDTPMNLYHKPLNKFVAGFIGSPSMNFVRGNVVKEDQLYFQNAGVKISIPSPLQQVMQAYVGKTVDMGFRPEYVYDKEMEQQKRLSTDVQITIQVVEVVGSESFNYFKFNGIDEIFSYRSSVFEPHKPGDKLTVGIDLERLHFFDTDTDLRIV